MNVVVLAHPERHSFVGALTDTAVETTSAEDEAVVVRDPDAMGPAPVAGPGDLTDVLGPVRNGLLRCCGFDVVEPWSGFQHRTAVDRF